LRAFVLSLALACVAFAAPPKAVKSVPIKVEGDTVTVVRAFPVTLTAELKDNTVYTWQYPSALKAVRSRNVLKVQDAPEGSYTIVCMTITIDFDKKTFEEDTVGKVPAPVPPGPTPPEPTPPTPVPVGPLRVLIVFESMDLPTMPPEQRDGIVRSLKFQQFLTDKTDRNGPNKRGWNIWERDQKGVELADKFWQDAHKHTRPSTPYIQLYKGDKLVEERVLPANQKEAMDLINKHAGG
jgi:hypothetical protein